MLRISKTDRIPPHTTSTARSFLILTQLPILSSQRNGESLSNSWWRRFNGVALITRFASRLGRLRENAIQAENIGVAWSAARSIWSWRSDVIAGSLFSALRPLTMFARLKMFDESAASSRKGSRASTPPPSVVGIGKKGQESGIVIICV